jgi:hypothetical protein
VVQQHTKEDLSQIWLNVTEESRILKKKIPALIWILAETSSLKMAKLRLFFSSKYGDS